MLARVARRHDLIGLVNRILLKRNSAWASTVCYGDPSLVKKLCWRTRPQIEKLRIQLSHAARATDYILGNAGCQLVDIATSESAFVAIKKCFEHRRRGVLVSLNLSFCFFFCGSTTCS